MRENVSYAVEIARPDTVDPSPEVDGLLRRLGIADTADRRPAELSGGERQRAALAQGLAKRLVILLADEPTANLDPAAAAEVVATIAEYCSHGMATIAAVAVVVGTVLRRLNRSPRRRDEPFEARSGLADPRADRLDEWFTARPAAGATDLASEERGSARRRSRTSPAG